jgi:hypothetical protein
MKTRSSLVVKIRAYRDGRHWCARGIGVDIFTCARTLDALVVEVQEAALCHFSEELASGKSLRVQVLAETEVSGGSKTAAD